MLSNLELHELEDVNLLHLHHSFDDESLVELGVAWPKLVTLVTQPPYSLRENFLNPVPVFVFFAFRLTPAVRITSQAF